VRISWRRLASGTFGITALLLVGCAGELGTSRTGSLTDSTLSGGVSSAEPTATVAGPIEAAPPDNPLLHRVAENSAADATPPVPDAAPEEPFDPFAKAEEAVGEEYDPWESFNTKIFEFNRQMDRWVLKPVAKGYNFIMPDFVQVGISNMFSNARFAPRFLNNVFQGKLKGAGIELGRFLINTTVGYAGFIDLATQIDLVTPEEDVGQTLGYYGVKPGPYLILPFLPPFTVRDFVGYLGDVALNPVNWLVAPIIEINGIPSVIAHKNRTTTTFVQLGARVGEIVNERSRNLEKFQGVEEATLDLYTAVRNAYLQRRAKEIRQ
jgi:phospholipid-binding lipoprotein MlaA